jgi:hypothetical protein
MMFPIGTIIVLGILCIVSSGFCLVAGYRTGKNEGFLAGWSAGYACREREVQLADKRVLFDAGRRYLPQQEAAGVARVSKARFRQQNFS